MFMRHILVATSQAAPPFGFWIEKELGTYYLARVTTDMRCVLVSVSCHIMRTRFLLRVYLLATSVAHALSLHFQLHRSFLPHADTALAALHRTRGKQQYPGGLDFAELDGYDFDGRASCHSRSPVSHVNGDKTQEHHPPPALFPDHSFCDRPQREVDSNPDDFSDDEDDQGYFGATSSSSSGNCRSTGSGNCVNRAMQCFCPARKFLSACCRLFTNRFRARGPVATFRRAEGGVPLLESEGSELRCLDGKSGGGPTQYYDLSPSSRGGTPRNSKNRGRGATSISAWRNSGRGRSLADVLALQRQKSECQALRQQSESALEAHELYLLSRRSHNLQHELHFFPPSNDGEEMLLAPYSHCGY
ncbi:unnamed protein product [Amoebophrya sp. A120]|nr:unnamed protein product [Amoebophrya sp. A120]|eukprot:GSA120T00001181001.1